MISSIENNFIKFPNDYYNSLINKTIDPNNSKIMKIIEQVSFLIKIHK